MRPARLRIQNFGVQQPFTIFGLVHTNQSVNLPECCLQKPTLNSQDITRKAFVIYWRLVRTVGLDSCGSPCIIPNRIAVSISFPFLHSLPVTGKIGAVLSDSNLSTGLKGFERWGSRVRAALSWLRMGKVPLRLVRATSGLAASGFRLLAEASYNYASPGAIARIR